MIPSGSFDNLSIARGARSPWRALVLAFGLCATGCVVDLSGLDDATIACATAADCPEGLTCNPALGRCVVSGVDVEPPAILLGPDSLSRRWMGRDSTLVITFTVSEPLGAEPRVELSWLVSGHERVAALVGREGELGYRYEVSTAAEDPEGSAALSIEVIDQLGNPGRGGLDNAVVFDFSPPEVINSTVSLQLSPATGNPLPVVSAVGAGTTVTVILALSEELREPPTLVAELGADSEAFALVERLGTLYTFELLADPGVSEGLYSLRLSAVDLADNGLDTALVDANDTPLAFAVDVSAPAAPAVDDPGRIVLSRAPWGVGGGPSSLSLQGGAGATEPFATLLAFDNAQLVELGRAVADSQGAFGGTDAPFVLASADRARVVLVAIDGAGNVSPSRLVRDGVWRVSLDDSGGGNPHRLTALLDSEQPLRGRAGTALLDADDLRSIDGDVATFSVSPTWAGRDHDAPPVVVNANLLYLGATERLWSARWDVAYAHDTWLRARRGTRTVTADPVLTLPALSQLTYDTWREVVLSFSGFVPLGTEDLWQWDGDLWEKRVAAEVPPKRAGATFAFDELRGQAVLFGGTEPFGVAPCSGGAVFVGACLYGDTWLWDGATWVNATPTSAGPSARLFAAAAYDHRLQRVVLHGGCAGSPCNPPLNDTWSWDGAAWVEEDAGTPPPARRGHTMAFDPGSDSLLMFGGKTGNDPGVVSGALYRFTSAGWQAVSVTGPAPTARFNHAMATHRGRDSVVLFGGNATTTCDGAPDEASCGELWEWQVDHWRQLLGPDQPTPRARAASAFDEGRGVLVLFGGTSDAGNCEGSADTTCGNTWEWEDGTWRKRCDGAVADCSPEPVRRIGAAMTYDTQNDRVLMFGGSGPANCDGSGVTTCNGTWSWNGTAWARVCGASTACTARVSNRRDMRIAWDEAGTRLVLFGGVDNSTSDDMGDTWEFGAFGVVACNPYASPCWRPVSVSGPHPRRNHAMHYDRARGVVVLTGGLFAKDPVDDCPTDSEAGTDDDNDCYFYDTWELQGSTWTKVAPTGASPVHPAGRIPWGFVYDTERARSVLYGGIPKQDLGGPNDLGDTWEWRNGEWRELAIQGVAPPLEEDPPVFFYDETTRAPTLLGAQGGKLWQLVDDAERRPAARLTVAVSAAGLAAIPVTYLGLEVEVVGVGRGGTLENTPGSAVGAPTYGLQIAPWRVDLQRWDVPSATAAPSSAIGAASLAVDAADVASVLLPTSREAVFRIEPASGQGNATLPPTLELDYVEARLLYRLDP